MTAPSSLPARTLFDKVWTAHEVSPETADTPAILYVDLHLIHEVTSPQAFSVLKSLGLPVRRPLRTLATMDHSTPTTTAQVFGNVPIALDAAAKQVVHPDNLIWVVVGDRAKIEAGIRDLGYGEIRFIDADGNAI